MRVPTTALRTACLAGVAGWALLGASCAPRPLELPAGPGTAFPSFAEAYAEASAGCRAVRSLRVELAISGRAAGERLRGRVLAGLQAPDGLRLEGVAPFGPPYFILVASGGLATLLLEREDRVLSDARPDDILDALVGIPLAPGDLLAALTGCVVAGAVPVEGRLYEDAWARVDLGGEASAFMRREEGSWRVLAGRVNGLTIEYHEFQNGLPRDIYLRAHEGSQDGATNLRVKMSEPELNVELRPQVFSVRVPPGTVPMTLEELRRGGQMRDERD